MENEFTRLVRQDIERHLRDARPTPTLKEAAKDGAKWAAMWIGILLAVVAVLAIIAAVSPFN